MTKLLIIRHGNTFDPGEEPRRVGCKTDLPLTQSGIDQARALGAYISREHLWPDAIYASALQRAQQTAAIMAHDADLTMAVETDTRFNEIDHGPDENKTEAEIIERLGKKALEDWNAYNVVPDGWQVDPRAIQNAWVDFAQDCIEARAGKTTCVVSSGGIIRFAPIIVAEPIDDPKVKTAAMSLFEHDGTTWHCRFWNKRA